MTELSQDNLYEPKRPRLIAALFLSSWVLILSAPIWIGKFLGGVYSDQFHSGYAFREWLAHTWRRTGEIPLWNPELFGGMPFVGAMHGDIFYPTAWLRLVVPTGLAMGLGFVVHYVLAGFFVYWLLRLMRVSWTGAVTGGFVYQLSGVVGSYVQPGHDGKLFVTALLPLALVGLTLALRDKKPAGYGVVSLSVGLALLSPHFQMTYYLLLAAGLYALYLTFEEPGGRSVGQIAAMLVLALVAVLVGFGIGMIQLMPFFEYLPHSPRAEGYYGFEGSTSYAIPWYHLPEFFLSRFTGTTPDQTYWGPNPLKLHSEYLGLAALALAAVGALDATRRRTVLWLGGIGTLFLLVCLGSATPFYRLWWTVMPFVKQTRAPGMALFVVALVVAVFVGFGVDRVRISNTLRGWPKSLMISGAVVILLALVGLFGGMAASFAQGIQIASGREVASAAARAAGSIRIGAAASGAALLLLGGLSWAVASGKGKPVLIALAFPFLVSADLFQNAAGFWTYSDKPEEGLYRSDQITTLLGSQPAPIRVLDLSDTGLDVYPGASLMAFDIPQLLGHHGNQLHDFNLVMGGKNQWQYLLSSRRLWDLYAVKYVLVPHGLDLSGQLPAYSSLGLDFDTLMTQVEASSGRVADVLVRRAPISYARVVPAALKAPADQIVPSVSDPRSPLSFDRLVLLDEEAPVDLDPVEQLPEPLATRADFESWDVGAMELRINPPAPEGSFLVVSENYYPGWSATVDDRPTQILKGNGSLITVPLTKGAESVTLHFRSGSYTKGRLLTLLSALVLLIPFVGPAIWRRLQGG